MVFETDKEPLDCSGGEGKIFGNFLNTIFVLIILNSINNHLKELNMSENNLNGRKAEAMRDNLEIRKTPADLSNFISMFLDEHFRTHCDIYIKEQKSN